MLRDKSVLFIAPLFHGYEQMIICKMEEMGAHVTFFPERDYSVKFKIVNNLFNSYLDRLQSDHYRNLLKKIKNQKIDYLFVIRGYRITPDFLNELRVLNPYIQMIMYQWDSNATNNFERVIRCFDRVLSFDYKDCEYLSLEYLPLFYTDDVVVVETLAQKATSDFFFMGTYIPERYRAVMKFKEIYGSTCNVRSFVYIPKTSLLKEKLKGTNLDSQIVSTDHMPRQTYLSLLRGTKVMVDVSNIKQTGLAMRVIEALSMRKKIATNNKYILHEPFYNPENICVFDAEDPHIPVRFIETPFDGDPHTLSIGEWLNRIFDVN